MNVDFHQRCGLAARASRPFDAGALEFDQADCTGLSGRQPAKQFIDRDCACHAVPTSLDRHDAVARQACISRGIPKAVDPLVTSDCHDPRPERSCGLIRVALGVNGEKGFLPRIFGGRVGKSPRIVSPQPGIQLAHQLRVGSAVTVLRGGHEAAPRLGSSLPFLGSRRYLDRSRRTRLNGEDGRGGHKANTHVVRRGIVSA